MVNLPSGLPEEINDDEDLARFLTYSKYFSSTSVKPAAFLPNPKDRETSVSRHGRKPLKTLWKLGAEAAGERTLYGAAIFKAADVRSALLDVFADEPPPRHAVIQKWPWLEIDLDLQKAQQKERAILLSSAVGEPFLVGKSRNSADV